MSEKNIEMMKKLIEAKKNKNSEKQNLRPNRSHTPEERVRKAFHNKKSGGVFD